MKMKPRIISSVKGSLLYCFLEIYIDARYKLSTVGPSNLRTYLNLAVPSSFMRLRSSVIVSEGTGLKPLRF